MPVLSKSFFVFFFVYINNNNNKCFGKENPDEDSDGLILQIRWPDTSSNDELWQKMNQLHSESNDNEKGIGDGQGIHF